MAENTYVRTAGGWQNVANMYTFVGSSWQQIIRAWTYTSGGWRLVYSPSVSLVISSDTLNYNIKTQAESVLGYTITTPITVNVTVNSGVVVGSNATFVVTGSGYNRYRIQTIAGPAMDTGSLPAGSVVNLVNNGVIAGAGGAGGHSSNVVGKTGGTAIKARQTMNITNNGVIGGGGGGGAGYYSSSDHIMGGGAGAGSIPSLGQQYGYHGSIYWLPSSSLYFGNRGGNDPQSGRGGDLGANGGGNTSRRGLAGFYADGNSLINWVVAGDRRGRQTG